MLGSSCTPDKKTPEGRQDVTSFYDIIHLLQAKEFPHLINRFKSMFAWKDLSCRRDLNVSF